MATRALPWQTRNQPSARDLLAQSERTIRDLSERSSPSTKRKNANSRSLLEQPDIRGSVLGTSATRGGGGGGGQPSTMMRLTNPVIPRRDEEEAGGRQTQPTRRASEIEIVFSSDDHDDSASGLTTAQDYDNDLDARPPPTPIVQPPGLSIKVDLPRMVEHVPGRCCFFLGYEACCAIYSALGCLSFVAAIVCLILYLTGPLSRYAQ